MNGKDGSEFDARKIVVLRSAMAQLVPNGLREMLPSSDPQAPLVLLALVGVRAGRTAERVELHAVATPEEMGTLVGYMEARVAETGQSGRYVAAKDQARAEAQGWPSAFQYEVRRRERP